MTAAASIALMFAGGVSAGIAQPALRMNRFCCGGARLRIKWRGKAI